MRVRWWSLLLVGWLVVSLGSVVWALPPNPIPTLPTGFTPILYVADNTATNLTGTRLNAGPTAMAFAPDGRLFIAERTGAIRVATGELTLLTTPFHTLTTITAAPPDERGLVGLVLDPNFASNGYVYVNYTVIDSSVPPTRYYQRISRLRAAPPSSNVSDGTETILFEMSDLNPANIYHVAGSLLFGADGKLYIATGENQNGANSQDLTVTHGKLLRINADGTIPTDNPFYGTLSGNNRAIWAYGLRNPFQVNNEPGTGRIFVNDVGASSTEEVNVGKAGANYGWPNYEGTTLRGGFTALVPPPEVALIAYNHSAFGFSCAVTGGAFYTTPALMYPTRYVGDYFYGDYCGAWVQSYDTATNTSTVFSTGSGFGNVGIRVSPAGELYYLRQTGGGVTGTVVRITYSGVRITLHPVSQSIETGNAVTFTCAATGGTPPLTYLWRRNGVLITGATTNTYTLSGVRSEDTGSQFTCEAQSSDGTRDTSFPATLTVTQPSVNAPKLEIADPALSKVGILLPGELGLLGERLEWVITVTNRGGAPAVNVVVTDRVRDELRVDEVRAGDAQTAINGQQVTVTFAQINPGQTVQYSIITTVLQSDRRVENQACLIAQGIAERCTSTAMQTVKIDRLPSTGETPRREVWVGFILVGLVLVIGFRWLYWR